MKNTEKVLDHKYELVQLESDPICASSGCDEYLHPKTKDTDWPKDYFVPHFGQDVDIIASLDNIGVAQRARNTTWIMGTKESKDKYHNDAKDTMYNFAPDLDEDIEDSHASLSLAEKQYDHKYELP